MTEKIANLVDLDVAAMSLEQALALSRQLAERIHSSGHIDYLHISASDLSHPVLGASSVLVAEQNTGSGSFTSTTSPFFHHFGRSLSASPNQSVHTFSIGGVSPPPSMSGHSPSINATGSTTPDETEIALAAIQRALSPPDAAYEIHHPQQPSLQDAAEGTEADWQAVKDTVLQLLKSELIDAPDTHLAFIRALIQPILDHHVEP